MVIACSKMDIMSIILCISVQLYVDYVSSKNICKSAFILSRQYFRGKKRDNSVPLPTYLRILYYLYILLDKIFNLLQIKFKVTLNLFADSLDLLVYVLSIYMLTNISGDAKKYNLFVEMSKFTSNQWRCPSYNLLYFTSLLGHQ